MGLDPWMVAGPSAPMMNGAAAAPGLPLGSPPPPPPPPVAWLPPSTPTPVGEAVGLSRGPPGYAPVPMRAIVDEEAALGFVSAPTGSSGVIRLGVGMEGAGVNSPPPLEVSAGPSIRAERRFGRLFGRAVAALNRRTGHRAGSWAPASLRLANTAPEIARPDHVVVDSSSDEEGSSVLRR
nr:T-cell leukemia homeobox protein 3-like [Aegilops tauschii subsp. strangulata]